MISGVGVDIVEISRIEKIWQKFGDKFAQRILHTNELQLFQKRCKYKNNKHQIEFLAGRFAVKEAIGKALGQGIFVIQFSNIDIGYDDLGRPICKYLQDSVLVNKIHISISHSNQNVIAYALLEK